MTGSRAEAGPCGTGVSGTPGNAAAGVVLAVVCAAQFMVVLDVSVVNVALPSIQRGLGFAPADLAWVASAYALVFGGFLLLGGRLADLYGHRRVFVAGLGLFTAASLVGGLATSPGALVGARAVQGLGAAVLAPVTLTVVTVTFPEGPRRTRALAVWTAVSLAGGAAGNLVGGALTEYLSWRSVLLINVPLGLAALVPASRSLPGGRPGGGQRLDVPGAVLATLALLALTYAISPADDRSATVTAAALGAALVALAAFVVVQARARSPLVPPLLWKLRAIWLGNVVMLLAGTAFQVPMWYFLTLYMQNVLHLGALETGLGFLPHTVLTLVVGLWVTPRLMPSVSNRTLVAAGLLIAAAGFAWQSRAGAGDTYLSGVLGPAVLMSLGGGLFSTPLTSTVVSGVAPADAGAASGLLNTAKQVGGALGLAALLAATASADGERGTGIGEAVPAADYGQAFALTAAALSVVAVLALFLPDSGPTTGGGAGARALDGGRTQAPS